MAAMPSATWPESSSGSAPPAGGSRCPIRAGNRLSTSSSSYRRDDMRTALPLIVLAAALASAPVHANPLGQAIAADLPGLVAIYRDLHANPELGFKESRSAGIMAAEAKKAGF